MDALAIIVDNLADDFLRSADLASRLNAYADDVVRHLLGPNGKEADDEELALSYRTVKDCLQEALPKLTGLPKALSLSESAVFSAEIIKTLMSKATVRSFLPTIDSLDGKCVYFRNAYADEAFRLFAPYLTSPTATYVASPQAACQEVYADSASFAILPISSSREGVIGGVKRFAERYELSPIYFTEITLSGREDSMTMGLFAACPITVPAPEGLEAILFVDETETLTSLITAATYLGADAVSIVSLSETEGFSAAYRLVFKAKAPESLTALRLLFLCEYPHHQLIGLYQTITKY